MHLSYQVRNFLRLGENRRFGLNSLSATLAGKFKWLNPLAQADRPVGVFKEP